MQLPGLDELEASVGKAVEALDRLGAENAELRERLRAIGKEIDGLAAEIRGIGSAGKVESRNKKQIEQRLKSIAGKLT